MENEYLPTRASIVNVSDETPDVKTFTLRLLGKDRGRFLKYQPGQFLILSIPGYGEAPFTFASAPDKAGTFQISVKRAGALTGALHSLGKAGIVGVRGPYGNTFPVKEMKGKDILFVAGGIGLAPLRSMISSVLRKRKDYKKIEIVYGARTPNDIVYGDQLKEWQNFPDTCVHLTVDMPDERWGGECGVVCVLFPKIRLNPKTSIALVCGPPVMIKFAIIDLLKLGFKEENIYASLERYMKCGIRKCGHCYIKGKYVCSDGPNFSYKEMKRLGIFS